MYKAAREGDVGELQRLFKKKPPPEIDSKDDGDETALEIASESNHVPIMKFLVERDARVSRLALKAAVQSNSLQAITYLVEISKDKLSYINYVDGLNDHTALHYAAARGNGETVRHLITLGADPTMKDRSGSTPLHFACSLRQNAVDVLKILVHSGVSMNARNESGNTCLHVASYADNGDHVEWLLSHNADPSIANNEKKTAWEVAVKNSYFSAIGAFAFKETEEHTPHPVDALPQPLGKTEVDVFGSAEKLQLHSIGNSRSVSSNIWHSAHL
jgi:ankyrin repeat protein